ncbi:MAG: hypothetical protein N2C12_07730, partial [Planctomycetales bacterium]
MRSNINLSRIVRACGCCGVSKVVCGGTAKVIDKIARDGASSVQIESHRTLEPALKRLRETGFRLIGLEQATTSVSLYDYSLSSERVVGEGNGRCGLFESDQAKASLT